MIEIPDLLYGYSDLEPYIDTATMREHHLKHHKAYADGLYKACMEYKIPYQVLGFPKLLKQYSYIEEVRNFGGGYVNHNLLWRFLTPELQKRPDLNIFINAEVEIEAASKEFFGSGWVWLVRDFLGQLKYKGYPNQDNPILYDEYPIWGIDFWEHAFYKKHGSDKKAYIKNVLKVTDWSFVEKRILLSSFKKG